MARRPVSLLLLLLLPALSLASRIITNRHLSLLTDPTQMNVQWVTGPGEILGNGTSTIQWGTSPRSLPLSALGYNWTYSFSGRNYTFNAGTMTGLTPGQTYFYRVGDPIDGWSSVSSFQATRTDFSEAAPLRVAWFGDLGWYNAQSLPYLQTEAMEGNMDLFTHVGDYAYDLQYQNGTVGDMFQASIEPITSTVPYVGCIGNHEYADNEAMYMNRFRVFVGNSSNGGLTPPNIDGVQAGEPNNLYYSFDIGLAHIVAVSTEMYFTNGGAAPQYAWLQQDLASVDRKKTPWLIVYGHRSIYCSCDTDCDDAATAVRIGQYGLEALMNQYGVDLWINGHEHNYERNYAVFNKTLATGASSGQPGGNASNPEVITNPTAPIYIVTGCAGDVEHHEPFTRPQPVYSAYRSNTYGYARMTIYNSSTLLWEAVQTDNEYPETTGTVIDAMLVVTNKH